MSIMFEEEIKCKVLLEVAGKMAVAARTAPKGKGFDNLIIAVAGRDQIELIAERMKNMVAEGKALEFYLRDADNILKSEALVLIGTKISPLGLKNCGLCGFGSCEGKLLHPETPCSFNTGDLGIAIGSAVSVATDSRVDNRVMVSVGMAARDMKLLGEEAKIIYGIPLSSTGKSPFFDRNR